MIKDDPYYIPSVPLYKPLGEELDNTIGDKFFEQNFSAASPDVIQKPMSSSSSSSMRLRSSSSSGLLRAPAPPPPEITNGVAPVRPRRSRSLLKPGRPSVESVILKKAVAKPPALNNPVTNETTGECVLTSSATILNKISADKNYKSAHATSSMRLRSSSMNGPLRVPAPPPLKTINGAALVQPRRSHSLLKPGRPSVESVMSKRVAAEPVDEDCREFPVPPLPEINNGGVPIRPRRSRSLLKPGRPSVESVILKKAVAEPPASSLKKSVHDEATRGRVSASPAVSNKAAPANKTFTKRRPSYLAPTYSSTLKKNAR